MSPGGLSKDPQSRSRSLANLRDGPAAPPGNRHTVTHGAYAALPTERVDAKVLEIPAAISEDAPVRTTDGQLPVHDTVAVRDLAEVLCRLDDIGEYLSEHGWHDKDNGKPRPVLDYEAQLRRHKLDLLRELGMTPLSRAKLLGQLDPGRGKKRSALDDFIHG